MVQDGHRRIRGRVLLTVGSRDRQAMLDVAPPRTGIPWRDAWTGATGEHLAVRWGLMVPDWIERSCHFALDRAVFEPASPNWRVTLFVHSPPAFRRRCLFVPLEPLARARFPRTEAHLAAAASRVPPSRGTAYSLMETGRRRHGPRVGRVAIVHV